MMGRKEINDNALSAGAEQEDRSNNMIILRGPMSSTMSDDVHADDGDGGPNSSCNTVPQLQVMLQQLQKEADRARSKDRKAMAYMQDLRADLEKVIHENEDLVKDITKLIGTCERTQREKLQIKQALEETQETQEQQQRQQQEQQQQEHHQQQCNIKLQLQATTMLDRELQQHAKERDIWQQEKAHLQQQHQQQASSSSSSCCKNCDKLQLKHAREKILRQQENGNLQELLTLSETRVKRLEFLLKTPPSHRLIAGDINANNASNVAPKPANSASHRLTCWPKSTGNLYAYIGSAAPAQAHTQAQEQAQGMMDRDPEKIQRNRSSSKPEMMMYTGTGRSTTLINDQEQEEEQAAQAAVPLPTIAAEEEVAQQQDIDNMAVSPSSASSSAILIAEEEQSKIMIKSKSKRLVDHHLQASSNSSGNNSKNKSNKVVTPTASAFVDDRYKRRSSLILRAEVVHQTAVTLALGDGGGSTDHDNDNGKNAVWKKLSINMRKSDEQGTCISTAQSSSITQSFQHQASSSFGDDDTTNHSIDTPFPRSPINVPTSCLLPDRAEDDDDDENDDGDGDCVSSVVMLPPLELRTHFDPDPADADAVDEDDSIEMQHRPGSNNATKHKDHNGTKKNTHHQQQTRLKKSASGPALFSSSSYSSSSSGGRGGTTSTGNASASTTSVSASTSNTRARSASLCGSTSNMNNATFETPLHTTNDNKKTVLEGGTGTGTNSNSRYRRRADLRRSSTSRLREIEQEQVDGNVKDNHEEPQDGAPKQKTERTSRRRNSIAIRPTYHHQHEDAVGRHGITDQCEQNARSRSATMKKAVSVPALSRQEHEQARLLERNAGREKGKASSSSSSSTSSHAIRSKSGSNAASTVGSRNDHEHDHHNNKKRTTSMFSLSGFRESQQEQVDGDNKDNEEPHQFDGAPHHVNAITCNTSYKHKTAERTSRRRNTIAIRRPDHHQHEDAVGRHGITDHCEQDARSRSAIMKKAVSVPALSRQEHEQARLLERNAGREKGKASSSSSTSSRDILSKSSNAASTVDSRHDQHHHRRHNNKKSTTSMFSLRGAFSSSGMLHKASSSSHATLMGYKNVMLARKHKPSSSTLSARHQNYREEEEADGRPSLVDARSVNSRTNMSANVDVNASRASVFDKLVQEAQHSLFGVSVPPFARGAG
jgi:hypothetical protein